jgi:hypothetical protein
MPGRDRQGDVAVTPFEVFTEEMARAAKTPRQKRNADRNAAIVADRMAGMKYAALAVKHGLTEARCMQICAAAGLPKGSAAPWNAEDGVPTTVPSGQYAGYKIRVARKPGPCDRQGCTTHLRAGERYVEGDGHPTRGPIGFSRERLCLKCGGVGS